MAIRELWTNKDGLQVRFGTERSGRTRNRTKVTASSDSVTFMEVPFTFNNMPGWDADANNDGTLDSFDRNNAYIPKGSIIQEAKIHVITPFTTSNSGALQIGTYQADGTVIDADGIDVAIAVTALDAVGETVNCDGAQINAVMSATMDGYVRVYPSTGSFTAGAATLFIKFVTPISS